MFHTRTVERSDVSHWHGREISFFHMVRYRVPWRDSMFYTGTVERLHVLHRYGREIR